ncbi:MAG: MarR family transcriptional regulator [Acidimicrobiaceae bacterium]|nr:MarR family transcriptional regulator [Acidimicrobiaceae bacterium]
MLRAISLEALAVLAPEVNLSEYRVLVLLDDTGPQRLIDVAAALEVTSTTATRLADRLVKHGMVERVRYSADRREIHLRIGEGGRELVRNMAKRRRRFVSSVLAEFPASDQAATLRVLTRFGQWPDAQEEGFEEATGIA